MLKSILTSTFFVFFTIGISLGQSFSVNPNQGNQGESISVSFSGVGTNFTQSTSTTFWMTSQQGSSTIYDSWFNTSSATSSNVYFNIPSNAIIGLYDVHCSTPIDGNMVLSGGFTINIEKRLHMDGDLYGQQGQTITIDFYGNGLQFSQPNPQFELVDENNPFSIIAAASYVIHNDNYASVTYNIPSNAGTGYYRASFTNGTVAALASNNTFLLGSAATKEISIDQNEGNKGEYVDVSFSGINTSFSQASPTATFKLVKGNNMIYGGGWINSFTSATRSFFIPINANEGSYDVVYESDLDGQVVITDGFTVLPALPPAFDMTPSIANQGDNISVSFSGTYEVFKQGSSAAKVWMVNSSNGSKVNGTGFYRNGYRLAFANFNLPNNADTGYYHVYYEDDYGEVLGMQNLFYLDTLGGFIQPPPPLVVSLDMVDADGSATCNGSVIASVTGGTEPYNYYYSNGTTGASATGLCPGYYYVEVTDGAGRSQVEYFLIAAADSSLLINNNDYPDSVITLSLIGDPHENCDIDYNDIESAEVTNYSLSDPDLTFGVTILNVEWTITFTNQTTLVLNDQHYVTENGVYEVYLNLYCAEKTPIYGHLKAADYIDMQLLNGISNQLSNREISIFPNPSNGQFIISTDQGLIENIQVLNQLGQVIESRNNLRNQYMEFESLDEGVYFVRIKMINDDNVYTEKLIIQK